METLTERHTHIKGWGIDADPQNEPTSPMKNYTGDDHNRMNYRRPTQQESDVEILRSNERPSLSAVYGTSSPPSGLSGRLRRFAFRFSESSLGHWIPLLFADRIHAVEGIIDDLREGHIPNIFAERGLKSEWKYNKKEVIARVVAGAIATTAVFFLMTRKRRRSRS